MNKSLREILQKGLNHILLEVTWFKEVLSEINYAWEQPCKKLDIPEEQALQGAHWLRYHALQQLQKGSKVNRGGHR